MKNNDELIEELKRAAIKLDEGVSIQRAEVVLSQAKEQGINGYVVVYNEGASKILYSLVGNVDDWYKKAVGMRKQEWSEFQRRVSTPNNEEIARMQMMQVAEFEPRIPEFVNRGERCIYSQKMPIWKERVESTVYSEFGRPQVIEEALNVMELLKLGVSYDEVYRFLWKLAPDHVAPARNLVLNYSKYGPDFIKHKFPELYEKNKQYIDNLVSENQRYESELANIKEKA